MSLKVSVRVTNEAGLHARPAADFVNVVKESLHEVRVSNNTGKTAPGNSILGLISLAVKCGEDVEIEVTGPDELAVMNRLKAVVAG